MTQILQSTHKIRLIASSDEVCCVLYQIVSTTQYESLQYTKFQLLLWLLMTFDLVPTQGEGVLSVSLLVQRRREMAYLVLTKAKHNRYHTSNRYSHHVSLPWPSGHQLEYLSLYCDCINSEYSETLALIQTLLELKYGVACCYGNVEPRGSHQVMEVDCT